MITENQGSPRVRMTTNGPRCTREFRVASHVLSDFIIACATEFAYVGFLGGMLLEDIDLNPEGYPNAESKRGTTIEAVLGTINTYGNGVDFREGFWNAKLEYGIDPDKALAPDRDQSTRDPRRSGKEEGPGGSIYTVSRDSLSDLIPLPSSGALAEKLPPGVQRFQRVPMVHYTISWSQIPDIDWSDIDSVTNCINSAPVRIPVYDVLCQAGTVLFEGGKDRNTKRLDNDGIAILDKTLDMSFKWREIPWDRVPTPQKDGIIWVNSPHPERKSFAPILP